MAILCVLRSALVDELVQQQARDHVQRLEHAFALLRGRGERRHLHFAVVEKKFHVLGRRDVGQVALVVLQHVRDVIQVELERIADCP